MMERQVKRRRGSHGPSPLSAATRKRLLAGLLARAEAGDNAAAESLVRLSLLRTSVAAAHCPIAMEAPA